MPFYQGVRSAAPVQMEVADIAFLSFSRFPYMMSFPDGEPWLHYADSLPSTATAGQISGRRRLPGKRC